MVWHLSLPLMNSFNKTEAAVFSFRPCFLRATLSSVYYTYFFKHLEVDCGALPYPVGMSTDAVVSSTTFGSTVSFECEGFYERKGQGAVPNRPDFLVVYCNKHGYWDFGTLRCQGKTITLA